MKKLLSLIVVCALSFALAACGGTEIEEVKGAATCTIEQDGVSVKMVMDAKGDVVTKITQTSVMSLEGIAEEQIEQLNAILEETKASYEGIGSVEYSAELTETELVETIVIPTDEETLAAVIEAGLLPVDGEDVTALSLEMTKENLAAAGWTVE